MFNLGQLSLRVLACSQTCFSGGPLPPAAEEPLPSLMDAFRPLPASNDDDTEQLSDTSYRTLLAVAAAASGAFYLIFFVVFL